MISSNPGKFRSIRKSLPAAKTSGWCLAIRRVRVCSPAADGPDSRPSVPRVPAAVASTARACGNGAVLSAVPDDPKYSRFASVSGTATWNPSSEHTRCPRQVIPGSSGPVTGPATRQNSASNSSAGIRSRRRVSASVPGACQRRAHGSSSSSPAIRWITSGISPSGISAAAISSRTAIAAGSSRCRSSQQPKSSTSSSISPAGRHASSMPSVT